MRKSRYKVIKTRTRTSAIIHGNSKYGLKYLPGQEVYAPKGTLGIFVFKTKTAAWDWADIWNDEYFHRGPFKDLTVIEVTPIGRGKTIVFASANILSEELDYFYSKDPEERDFYGSLGEVPDRTMAYPGVLVLE